MDACQQADATVGSRAVTKLKVVHSHLDEGLLQRGGEGGECYAARNHQAHKGTQDDANGFNERSRGADGSHTSG